MLFPVLIGMFVLGAAGTRADNTASLEGSYGDPPNPLGVVLTPTATQYVYSAQWRIGQPGSYSYAPGVVTVTNLRNGPIYGTCNCGYFPSGQGWYYFTGAAANGVWTWHAYRLSDNLDSGPGTLTLVSAPDSADLTLDLGGGVYMEFMLISPGQFMMGSTNTGYQFSYQEQPVHLVVITNAFYMGKYLVTQEQYQKVTGSNPGWPVCATNPINNVPEFVAENFLTQLNAICGKTTRLPHEVEWEYACRAGTTTEYFFGDSTNDLPLYAWYADNSVATPHPVGLKLPNPWGLYDMYGNVREWCCDIWCYLDGTGGPTDHMVVRGGDYDCIAEYCRSASRNGTGTGYTGYPGGAGSAGIGFRVVIPVPAIAVSVSITLPANNSVFFTGDNVTINATASSSNSTIAKVEFYQGSTKLGEDTSSPYSYAWTSVPAGTYSLTARAIDNNSVTGTSMWVGITVLPQTNGLPVISQNAGASDITTVSVTMNGNLLSTGTSATAVSLYWGTGDPGTTTVGWNHVVNFGQCAQGPLSTNVTGLTSGATYYYRFYATNTLGEVWGIPAVQFKTLSAPTVDNGAGATNITPMSAQLQGNLTAGNSADVTMYWGTADAGTTASVWQHANSLSTLNEGSFQNNINGLNPNTLYYYRCYATNSVGSDWADSTASFETAPTLANGWAYGMKIRFAGYTKSEALSNFPALIIFGPSIADFTYSQCQSPYGWDLRFADSSQVTALNYEISQWNTSGTSYVWVQVPRLSGSNDYIWAYWGNTGAAGAPAVYTTNGATWDANCYKGVWHLGEKLTQNQSAGTNYDSTARANHGLQRNNGWTGGIFGGAQNFNGSNAYINTVAAMTNGAMTNAMTLSLWVKVLGASDWGSTMIMLNQNNGNIQYYFSNQMKQKQSLNLGAGDRTGNASLSTGVWYYLTETFSVAGGNYSTGYINAAYDGNYSRADKPGTAGTWYFGKTPSGSAYHFQGAMQEIRVEQVRRSSNWIWACYQTMASNITFTSYQVQSGAPTATTHGIPYSWLASYGITNRSDSVETENPDGDDLDNQEEYIAGTDPTSLNSCFLIGITNLPGQVIVRVPSILATGSNYNLKTRYYDIEQRTNLLTGSWQTAPGYAGVFGNGNVIAYTNTPQDRAKYYRAKVRLQ